jgi:2-oxoglutarate ferredoxin oxidoreductase subunit delta
MPTVNIEDKGCRGCTLCVDICPVDVFEFEDGNHLAKVARADDCIGCLSCFYICPSQCVEVGDIELMRPFHRMDKSVSLIEKFLQTKAASTALTDDDLAEARKDVGARLRALSVAITDTMGRAQRAVGRKSGTVAAEHLPEVFEEDTLEGVLNRMQDRFRHAFDFDFSVNGSSVDITFNPCGLYSIVEEVGDKPGESVLCQVFHEYWAGLISSFASKNYKVDVPQVGESCVMKLNAPE